MSKFYAGQLVEAFGLENNIDLNGKCGEVICREDFGVNNECYHVDIDDKDEWIFAYRLRPLPPFDFKLLQTKQMECKV